MRLAAAAALLATSALADEVFTVETIRTNVFGHYEVFVRLTPAPADLAFLECFALEDGRAVDSTIEMVRDLHNGGRVKLTFDETAAQATQIDCSLSY